MGASSSRRSTGGRAACSNGEMRSFGDKLRLMREEINGIMREREKETKAYKRDVMVFALKEAEWRKEKRRLREEVRRLKERVVVEEEEEGEKEKGGGGCSEWEMIMERLREERAMRDEAVEKWKQLYMAIKVELDDLIQQSTFHYGCSLPPGGDRLYGKAEVEELKKEVMVKEGTTESLRAQVASLKMEKLRLESEVDILRQSLRIMSSNRNPANSTTKSKSKSKSKSAA